MHVHTSRLQNLKKQRRSTINTLSFFERDTCPLLQRVPRTLPAQTSKPLSARINPNDCIGESRNHASPDCSNIKVLQIVENEISV